MIIIISALFSALSATLFFIPLSYVVDVLLSKSLTYFRFFAQLRRQPARLLKLLKISWHSHQRIVQPYL